MSEIKLVAFDLDGVLIDGRGSWMEVHKGLGTLKQSEAHEREYNDGKITFDEWAKKDVNLWKGTQIQKITKILHKAPLMNGIHECLPALRRKYRLVIVSGGLQILADRIKNSFKMDYAIANELLVDDNKIVDVNQKVDFNSKGKILKAIAKKYGLLPKECAAVGDYVNDIPMFGVAGYSIAFDPKHACVVEAADDVVYERNLGRILDFL